MEQEVETKVMLPRVLAVDDSALNLRSLSLILQQNGFAVETARSGEAALRLLKHSGDRFDLLILDLMMPGMNGIDVLRAVREDDSIRALPVIFLSDRNDSTSVIEGLENGGNDFLGKPVNARELCARANSQIELYRNRRRLLQLSDELQKTNAEQRQFFSILAHDLRGPLGGIRNMIELCTISPRMRDDPEHLRNAVGKTLKPLDRTLELLENVLLWGRSQMGSFADEGEEEDPPQIIEVRELIDGMVELFTPIAERKGVKLNTEGPDDVFISVKLTLISAILRNLIQNAIKFSHKGGNVNLVWTTGGKRVGIFVQDEGVGIAKETQTKLFEVGYCKSTRGTDNEVGSGFGLQLCASLAKAIGSELVFESEPGAGSTFSLEMPAWLVEAANAV